MKKLTLMMHLIVGGKFMLIRKVRVILAAVILAFGFYV